MVAFQRNATSNIWILASKIMRFLRFQPKFKQSLNLCQCGKICPKLITLKNYEIPPEIEFLVFLSNKNFYVYKKH